MSDRVSSISDNGTDLPIAVESVGRQDLALGEIKVGEGLSKALDRLTQQREARVREASGRIVAALGDFAKDPDLQMAEDAGPAQLVLALRQPDGTSASRLRVRLAGAEDADGNALVARRQRWVAPLRDGSVILVLPPEWHRRSLRRLDVVIGGGDGPTPMPIPLPPGISTGDVLPVALPRPVPPAPLALLDSLAALAALDEAGGDPATPPTPLRKSVNLGEGDCAVTFGTDTSQDRFPFSLLFRLTDPGLSLSTLTRAVPPPDDNGRRPLRAIFPGDGITVNPEDLQLADRVAVDRPVSVEAFRRGLSGVATPRRIPLAATLALGYVVRLAQRWTQKGLALGDLVYSLPLAPGEQQRIAVVERTATSSVQEREALEQREDLRFDERDTSSVQATFQSAFNEAAQGGSSYEADSSSFSVAAAAGGGGVFPFGAFGGGVATSYGSASASGSTSTWMSGSRRAASSAAQSTQAAVSRRASAARSATRSSVRLATASETTQVTTKVITNHNKTRALTMQYWEVLRLFDVHTVVEDASLVCLVPVDVVDFLPARQPPTLGSGNPTRSDLLGRYARLLEHADVLMRVVPWRLRRGLRALNDFAADPRATVQGATGAAMTTLSVTVSAGMTVVDEVSVQFLLRGGARTGVVPLTPAAPLPSLPTGSDALSSEAALFATLRNERAVPRPLTASITLPASVSLADLTGTVIFAGAKRLDYTFNPPGITLALSLPSGNAAIASLMQAAATQGTASRSFAANRMAQEVGPLPVFAVTATAAGSLPVVSQAFAGGTPVPGGGLTVPANRMPPELSYDSLLEIERTLQWVVANTSRCSVNVVAALTAEERAMMLDRYTVTPPTVERDGTVREGIPLLSCVTNDVLGFYGNSIVLPFMIPAALAEEAKVDTARVQRALMRFHAEGFEHPASTVALPTRGVLGEAVLGSCPSAEKIDLTRFWNWQDSPGDEATEIGGVAVPQGSLLAGAAAPNALGSLAPIINNFSTQGPTADSALASALAQRTVEFSKPFDAATLTNAGNLKDVVNKTTEVAESARKDALAAAKELAVKAMETSAQLKGAKAPGGDKPATPAPAPGGTTQPAGGTTTPAPTPAPQPPPIQPPPPAPAARPATLSLFFDLNQTSFVEATQEGRAGQQAKLDAFIAAAKAFNATAITVRGYASPEGPRDNNIRLVKERAERLQSLLQAQLTTASIPVAWGGIVDGPPTSQFPELRRADASVTAP